jgi:hypothetical protein
MFMVDKNSVEVLKKAIQKTLNSQHDMQDNDKSDCKIISGRNSEPIDMSDLLYIFETSIVEKLIRNIIKKLKNKKDCKIGWEVPYPKAHKRWSRAKCDLALDCIETKNNEEYLFRTVVEVKRAYFGADMLTNNWEPYDVWADIYKIIGYYDDENPEVGKNKFVLLFLPYYREWGKKYSDFLRQTFISKKSFENKKGKLTHKEFLIKKLSWKKEKIKTISGRPEFKKDHKAAITIEPFILRKTKQDFVSNRKVAAVLLRIG